MIRNGFPQLYGLGKTFENCVDLSNFLRHSPGLAVLERHASLRIDFLQTFPWLNTYVYRFHFLQAISKLCYFLATFF